MNNLYVSSKPGSKMHLSLYYLNYSPDNNLVKIVLYKYLNHSFYKKMPKVLPLDSLQDRMKRLTPLTAC